MPFYNEKQIKVNGFYNMNVPLGILTLLLWAMSAESLITDIVRWVYSSCSVPSIFHTITIQAAELLETLLSMRQQFPNQIWSNCWILSEQDRSERKLMKKMRFLKHP